MASIRSRDTKPEMTVRRYLHGLGFRYHLASSRLAGKPDLVLPRHEAVIFVHGCFWHGHNGCRFATVPATRTDFWQAKIASNKARDATTERRLRDLGWRVAIVWECALRQRPEVALKRLERFLLSSRKQIDIASALTSQRKNKRPVRSGAPSRAARHSQLADTGHPEDPRKNNCQEMSAAGRLRAPKDSASDSDQSE